MGLLGGWVVEGRLGRAVRGRHYELEVATDSLIKALPVAIKNRLEEGLLKNFKSNCQGLCKKRISLLE